MDTIFIETYYLDSDISVGLDIYDVDCGMIGSGYYHIPFSSLVFKDFSNGEMINIICSESEILSFVCDYFDDSMDHIL